MKILIVDDLDANRKLLRVNMEVEGWDTLEANHGVEALALLEHETVDAIISDILMPQMDGYRFCQEVRRQERFRHLPFIFYTSTYTSPGDEQLALDCGADRYLKKPAPISTILSAIQELNDPARQAPVPATSPDETLVMREYNEALVRKLEERNAELELAREEVARANEALEERVRQRTAELELANQELEAFSHSIAHDLRSPLSAVVGFTNLLIRHSADKLDKDEMESLQFIANSAVRMNDLTNDLLRLARANRAEMNPQEINLSFLAAAILEDLAARHPDRTVATSVAPGVTATGDQGLLQIVMENLLNNAWKYTGRTAETRIEFGATRAEDRPAYFVRDNGVGFDMAMAGGLFNPFCRLPSAKDFAGTGIGLNTVRRIVTRHEGRVWAQSASGEGATFFFTLGTTP